MIKLTLTIIAALFLTGRGRHTPGFSPSGFASTAEKYSGLHERENRKALSALVGVDPSRIPWCGFFAAAIVSKSVRRGDVVVMRNHVTFFTRRRVFRRVRL